MTIVPLLEAVGDRGAALLAGLCVGVVFGVAAQRSRFCLRAATVEFGRGRVGPRTSVWLLCFSTAVFWTQLFALTGLVPLDEARFLASPGSLSGAAIGGLVFGVGMVLARGCSGRLLVLAGTGNLRALLAGLVFAVAAQVTLHGALSPMRQSLAALWTTGTDGAPVIGLLGLPEASGLLFGAGLAVAAVVLSLRAGVGIATLVFGSGVGFAVGLGWLATAMISAEAFEIVPVGSITFSGPSADTLMAVLTPVAEPGFDIGLVPGVFLGAFAAALLSGEVMLQGYDGAATMARSLTGAAMMGFGAMLAGGCAIGAGVTGASTFALAPWVALSAMWAGAMATDRLVDQAGGAARPA